MCNRYRMSASQADLARRYGIEVPYPEDESYPPSELFPDKPAWVVREEEGRRAFDVMAWGVPTQIPGKRIDKATGKPVMLTKSVTNVRNLTSPIWRSMLDKPTQRCLVPVTTFSEYGQVRGEDGRLPLHWFDVPSRPIFSFAGIWRPSTPVGRIVGGIASGSEAHVQSTCPRARDHRYWHIRLRDELDAGRLTRRGEVDQGRNLEHGASGRSERGRLPSSQ